MAREKITEKNVLAHALIIFVPEGVHLIVKAGDKMKSRYLTRLQGISPDEKVPSLAAD